MSKNDVVLLKQKICSFDNLFSAYKECSRGKRSSYGYQESLFAVGEELKRIQTELATNSFKWSEYKEFYVKDPKRRLIRSAPFLDRVVHHAIHRIIEPIIDKRLSNSVFACRLGMGNRNAVNSLWSFLKNIGENRFVMKLDVKNYFHSIDQNVLYQNFVSALPDSSLNDLLKTLIFDQPPFKGIPIGNLTSQLFANFYLSKVDIIVLKSFSMKKNWKQKDLRDYFYIRYMDDLVLCGKDKKLILDTSELAIAVAERDLKLNIPINKRIPLAADPVPFLGYVFDHKG